jgi:hypothetical protein
MFSIIIPQKDTKSAGCYNLECPGYVPTTGAALVPGQVVTPPSSYGVQDRYVRLSLNKVHLFPRRDTNTRPYQNVYG